MIPVNPVGESESINPQLPHQPLPRQPAASGAAAEASAEFHVSLLAQHALQLDPDGGQGQAATPQQLDATLTQLLGLLQERIDDLKERALLAGGRPAHGLFAELEQVAEVLVRLVNLWPRLAQSLPQQLQQARDRLRPLFASCHFLLRALQHSAEPGSWRQLAENLAASEQKLLA